MAYLFLAMAIFSEVLGTIALKYSEGFTKVIPSLLVVVSYGVCFVGLALALKSLPMSVVYAIWAGVGTALVVVLGQVFFAEPLTYSKALATFLIVAGVVMLNLGESKEETAEMAAFEKIQATDISTIKDFDAPPRVIESVRVSENAG